MSKRAWSTGFAIGLGVGVGIALIFLVWSFPGFRNPTYQQDRYSYAQNDETGEDNPVVRPSIWEVYTKPTDTYAQWIMAFLSIVATGVSVWAVWLVRNTLEHTRLATKAAVDTAEITQNALFAQERPWLTLEFRMGGGLERNEREWSTGTEGIVIIVKNIGKTTAVDVTINAKLIFWPIIPFAQQGMIWQFANKYLVDENMPIPGPIHIFPGVTETVSRGVHAPVNEVDELRSSTHSVLYHFAILACVSYRTVLDRPGTERKLTVVGKDVYKFRDGSDRFIDLFRGEVTSVPKSRIDLREPIGKSAIIT